METVLSWLLLMMILLSVWYVIAYLVAFVHLRERMLFLPMAQWILVGVGLGSIVLNNGTPVLVWVMTPLLIGLALAGIWRRHPRGLALILRSYPRGTLDVLSFRRPVIDLKRRVRTK
ncbi:MULTISPECIES: hypothetical protein [Chloroflexus]|uniref:Uncharacterized protein n=1 Tax=Chloroflexus islandicus TaxID=1707952 RepID=A0A178MD35_9CHLR|nr:MULTISPECIES: hypothetical protein [Chloroflexus]OAN45955.1 hypothetical protein A6A03_01445 [Chloroflexus islandicus]